MANIIKFPGSYWCDDCGKDLPPGEGELCPVDGCEVVGCFHCVEVSSYCLDHMELDPNGSWQGKSKQKESPCD